MPADLSSKKTRHVTALAESVTRLLAEVSTLKALAQEAQDLHYSDPDPQGLQDADFVGGNAYISPAVYKQVVQTLIGLDSQMAAPGASGAPSVYAVLRQVKP
jgi:hypothetical protein